jgi:tRNA 2-selenouridine synthase
MFTWNDPELRNLFLKQTPLIDVRAPIEFLSGSIPGSINLPILNDAERALIGTCYKEQGQEAAIILGHKLVNGSVKEERVHNWEKIIHEFPQAQVFCFRGGLRSQISCQWLAERGIDRKPIKGGYKRLRQFFLSYLEEGPTGEFLRLGGVTGSGKTRLLSSIKNSLDLESMANHRGSAFGSQGEQPSQVRFENEFALGLLKLEGKKIIVEDESQMIGKRTLPKRHFSAMRNSPLILLKVTDEEQARNIFQDYVIGSQMVFFQEGLERIKSRLSKEVVGGIAQGIQRAFDRGFLFEDHEEWINLLLKHYYNPLYLKDLSNQKDKIIFEGPASEVLIHLVQIP